MKKLVELLFISFLVFLFLNLTINLTNEEITERFDEFVEVNISDVEIIKNLRYYKANYLFENYKYNLSELIEKNNLTKKINYNSPLFNTNEEIKELAENLTLHDVQEYILDFPFDKELAKNISAGKPITVYTATDVLERNKGVCMGKSLLACSIFYEKNIPCYSGGNYKHSIALVYYNESWRPVLTTGFVNKDNIDEFMSTLNIIRSKYDAYMKEEIIIVY